MPRFDGFKNHIAVLLVHLVLALLHFIENFAAHIIHFGK
jgi:hypothetical protein